VDGRCGPFSCLGGLLEQMFGSSDDKRSSSKKIPGNVSSLSIHIDQDQEEQSSVQKEEVKSVSLGKLDYSVSQTGLSGFGRTKIHLAEEDDCFMSSFDNENDGDHTDEEYDDQDLLLEFQNHISKNMKLQKRHGDLLCSHEKLMDSYALIDAAHEVMVKMVKDSQPHTCTRAPHSTDLSCANSCCSQAKPSCDEHVLVETYDNLIASENDELKTENEMLKMELS
jgi:hypothetical protein